MSVKTQGPQFQEVEEGKLSNLSGMKQRLGDGSSQDRTNLFPSPSL